MNKINEKATYQLYAVTNRSWASNNYPFLTQLEDALRGGVTCVQLREKNCSYDEYLTRAKEVVALCHNYETPCLINDNVEVAINSGADGVHVGQSDRSASEVRTLIGPNKILGVTVKTVEQALEAQKNGATYLGTGAVFNTSTKLDTYTIEHSVVSEICQAVSIPVIGIGGITKENLSQLEGLNLSGVAIVSGIFANANIKQACEILKEGTKKL